MHDIRFIRDNPEAFDAGLKARFLAPQSAEILALDAKRREAITRQQEAEQGRNALSKQIGQAKAKGDEAEFERLRGEVDRLKAVLEEAGAEAEKLDEALNQHLAGLPNLPEDGVPIGEDEDANEEVRGWGEPREFSFTPKDHSDLGEGLGMLDFDAAAKISGARFSVLKGGLARLERALAQFMLDLHTSEHGYTEVSPPYMVRDEAMFGTGQLPKFAEDLFRTTDDRWLIPTAEVPLTNLVRDAIHDEGLFPLRMTAHTPCFRAEAGSAGRDTRGLIRQHQFHKVEMVSITTPEQSADELDRMTGCAEEVLRRLELPYRVMLLSSGDMGFGAKRTYDLEVWLPSQNTYREISSCSNCGDFQARRMNARFRREGEKKPDFLHTLNGSGVAVGRAMLAVMENHQNEDGSINIPKALQPYMGGLEVLRRD
ncbi:serine--tRNA ligase [Hyphobacterium sp. SN044]|uniref:serine--tRNA ligase n=1 Tax=Hyphobacterium sp. SN044 TaxID=2912575 RepID=UPI001F02A9A7|nr:serine--tRNA ligase [Hyphobacterium sp. SN044]MCF8879354.1 serine--tRNA ligase [Hyphobacterium sp. SN044]